MIIIIAILAVVVFPRFMNTSNFSSYTLRDEFISELRKAQLLALNNQDRCFRVQVTSLSYQLHHMPLGCTGSAFRSEQVQSLDAGAFLRLTATASDSFNVDFDNFGRSSLGCAGDCISVIAEETLSIAIESEGYIHAN